MNPPTSEIDLLRKLVLMRARAEGAESIMLELQVECIRLRTAGEALFTAASTGRGLEAALARWDEATKEIKA